MTDRSFDAMRQDAIRRSREMQRRAVQPSPPAPPPPPPSAPPPPPPPKPAPPPPPKPNFPLSGELQGLLRDWDAEKLGIAGLLYLLYKEGTDPALLLALAYILL